MFDINLGMVELFMFGAFILGSYIKNKLDHTRGSTVDVTIIPLNKKIQHPCTTKKINYKNNGYNVIGIGEVKKENALLTTARCLVYRQTSL
jgi:D-alanyl-D-alanine dipeptidase